MSEFVPRFEYDFDVGDTVEVIVDHPGGNYDISIGDVGTVVVGGRTDVGVRFDRDIGGHDLGGRCELYHGWFILKNELAHFNGDLELPDEDDGDFEEFLNSLN